MQDATRVCAVCGSDISGTHHRRKYCSDVCFVQARNAQMLAGHHRRKIDPEYRERRTQYARTSYERMVTDPDKLAVQRARTQAWRAANPDTRSEQYRSWRLANASRVYAKNARQRARRIDAFVEDVDRDAIFERDGWVCRVCLGVVDASLAWPHPESATLDHVVPLAKGGTHEPANAQLAHARCNSRKGDRLGPPA